MSINTEMTALADAIRSKSGTSGKLSISGMTTAVNGIVKTDLSSVTATAETMLSDTIAIGKNGETIVGNIPTVTAKLTDNEFTVEKGYISSKQTLTVAEMTEPKLTENVVTIEKGYNKSKKTVTIPEMTITNDGKKITVPVGYNKTNQQFNINSGVDTSDATATASQILSGATAYVKGAKITGNIKTVTAVSDGEFVTVPAGFHPTEQTFPISSGDVGSNVEYGYVDADGKIQKIDLSGDTPVTSGEPVEMDIVAFVTGQDEPAYNPETPGGGGGSGTFDLAKVTQYSPAVQAFSGLSKIIVSGLGYDYDTANGTYNVTAETEKESDIFKRIYKHTSGGWYIWGEYEPEYEEGYWYIGVAPDSGNLCCWTSEEFSDGEYYFEDWDSGDAFDVSLDVTKTTYPATDMVLKGVMATGYENSQWSFDEAETDFTGFETTPRISNIYALAGSSLIGAPVSNAAKNDFSADSALFALDSWRGLNELVSGTIPTGYKVDNPSAVLADGVFCFDHKRALQYQIGDSLSALTDFTIEMDYTITSDYADYCGFFGNRTSWTTNCICLQWGRTGRKPSLHWNGVADGLTGGNNHDEWVNDGKYHHVALVRSGSTVYLFSDGKLLGTANGASNPLNLAAEGFLTVGVQRVENDILPGRMKHFRIVPFALYTADFSNNIPTWVGA